MSFQYNKKSGHSDLDARYVWVIAQELQEVAPSMVDSIEKEDGYEYLSVNTSEMTFMFVNAFKEQQATIESQEERIADLEEKLEKMVDLEQKVELLLAK